MKRVEALKAFAASIQPSHRDEKSMKSQNSMWGQIIEISGLLLFGYSQQNSRDRDHSLGPTPERLLKCCSVKTIRSVEAEMT